MKALALLLMLLGTACSSVSGSTYDYTLDCTYPTLGYVEMGDFPDSAKAAVENAVDDWNSKQNKILLSKGWYANADLQVRLEISDDMRACGSNCDGFAVPTRGFCRIVVRPGAADQPYIWKHELGHCMGLGHTDNVTSIMHPVVYTDKVTQDAVDEISEFPYCED